MTIAMVIKLYLIAPIISWECQHSCDIVYIISFADIRKTISFQLVWCDTVFETLKHNFALKALP